jgi:dCTP deaminase
MLGNSEIRRLLYVREDQENKIELTDEHLLIVPCPDKEALERAGAASIDLRLGRWFRSMRHANIASIKIESPVSIRRNRKAAPLPTFEPQEEVSKELFTRFGSEFILHPGQFVLGGTLEWIKMPVNAGGYVIGKSSLGRRGLVIETAAGIHPGFTGCLTLELANVGEVPIALVPGMQICQIFLHQIAKSEKAARSQFVGRRKPGLGRLKADQVLDALSGKKHS